MLTASICTIGDEILIGQVTDTNSGNIARALEEAGIHVRSMVSVGDAPEAIEDALKREIGLSDIVITTGGLGPTKDDITKAVLARFSGSHGYREDPGQLEMVHKILRGRGLDVLPINLAQAQVPEKAEVIVNKLGTAPIMVFRSLFNKATLYALPGVPHEAVGAIPAVLGDILAHFKPGSIIHRNIMVYGMAESALSEKIAPWEDALPSNMHLAYLPNTLTGIRLRLSSYGGNEKSLLERFSRDLTAAAEKNELDPVIGRETEIQRIIQILIRRTKNNPVLIGEPGVGKSAVAEGLAQRIVQGNVPELLLGKRVMSLDIGSMVAGTKYRGEFEERLKNVMDELHKAGNVLLFIDEIHTIIGAGATEGSLDAANILKPALSRGEIQCIGATTLDEYRKHIEKDAALERRFQPVVVGEPTAEETLSILYGLRDRYEAHHKVRITDEALAAAVKLSDRYIPDRYLPDKAIDLMDEAASRVRIAACTAPPDVREQEKRLAGIR